MDRRLIAARELRSGQRVFVEPRDGNVSRGPKLDRLPPAGAWVRVNDYIHGLVARGAVTAFDGPPVAPVQVVESVDEEVSRDS